jgi:hypothetical protein
MASDLDRRLLPAYATGHRARPAEPTGPKERNRRPANELSPETDPVRRNQPAAGERTQLQTVPVRGNQSANSTQTDPVRRNATGGRRRNGTEETNPTRSAPAPCPKPALRSVWLVKGRRPIVSRRPPDPLTSRADRGNDHNKGAGTTSHNRPEQRTSHDELDSQQSRTDLDSQQPEPTWTAGKPQTTRPCRCHPPGHCPWPSYRGRPATWEPSRTGRAKSVDGSASCGQTRFDERSWWRVGRRLRGCEVGGCFVFGPDMAGVSGLLAGREVW